MLDTIRAYMYVSHVTLTPVFHLVTLSSAHTSLKLSSGCTKQLWVVA
jgi:hypothetical protein